LLIALPGRIRQTTKRASSRCACLGRSGPRLANVTGRVTRACDYLPGVGRAKEATVFTQPRYELTEQSRWPRSMENESKEPMMRPLPGLVRGNYNE
jgi:hypothetical protein